MEKALGLPTPLLAIAAIVLLVLVVFIGRFCSAASTIEVTVNGSPVTIHGAKTLNTALRESGLPVNPGDLVSLDGKIIKKSAGHPFNASVGDVQTNDPDYQLRGGETIVFSDGGDLVEDYDTSEDVLPHGATLQGLGALSLVERGADGVTEYRTGRISGATVKSTKQSATDAICTSYDPDTGDDKVIALTFDEGPTEEYTEQILDILEENSSRATFFCVGADVATHPDIVKREHAEGHQVCTNTYSRSWTTDRNSSDGSIDATLLVDEVKRGMEAISSALDGEQASRLIRLPNGAVNEEIVAALDDEVDGFVGWNLDTGDWTEGSSDGVYETLMQVEKGDIVMLHDGGGNHEATVSALRKALPRLKLQGFSFVTVDELLGYPPLQ